MIDNETKRLMENWAAWVVKRPKAMAFTGAYNLDPRRREEGPRVLIDDEAEAVDRAVHALEPQLKQAVIEYWLKSDPIPRKARRCGCGTRTFWYRLQRAHLAIRAELQERRAIHQRARARRAGEGLSKPQADLAQRA